MLLNIYNLNYYYTNRIRLIYLLKFVVLLFGAASKEFTVYDKRGKEILLG
jgi:hypothetical protein